MTTSNRVMMNEPIPEIGVPVLKPEVVSRRPTSLRELANRAANEAKRRINDFAGWILSHVPETIVRTTSDRLRMLKVKVEEIYEGVSRSQRREDEPRLIESSHNGFLKTFRIDDVGGETM